MPKHNDLTPLLKSIGYIIDNNINAAIVTLKSQILHGNDRPENYIILGKLYRKQGDLIRAIKLHENINSMDNIDKKIKNYNLVELIYSYYDYGDYEKTIYYLNSIKNKDIELYKVFANACIHTKSYDKAIKLFKKLEKQQVAYARNIAYCYFLEANETPLTSTNNLKKIKKGLKYYSRSRKGNMLLIDYYYKKNDHKECIKAIEHFIIEKLAKSDTDLHELEKIYFDIDKVEN
jgi:lipopolysaccharide biosynthesis regulator YciM